MSTTKSNNLELEPINSRTSSVTPPTTTDKENRVAFRGYGATGQTVVPVLLETPASIFTVDEEALKDFYVTCKDVEMLGKELFKMDVRFIDKCKLQNSRKKVNQFILLLSGDNPSSVYFCFDPFHLCAKQCITQRMINFSKSITGAALSKQHIRELFETFLSSSKQYVSNLLKPFLSSRDAFFYTHLTEDEKLYLKLARDIVDKCQQANASVMDVLNMMNSMQAPINASKTKNKEHNNSREEFLFRLEYIYYLQYGKGYDQVQAINREKACLNAENNNHAVEKHNAQSG
jgi:hypothetical protein